MMTNYLAFVGSRMAFNEFIRPESWAFADPERHPAVIVAEDTVLRPLPGPAGAGAALLPDAEPPEWLRMLEVIEIGPNIAVPEYEFYEARAEPDEDEVWYEAADIPLIATRQSALERPTFGRRMLLLWTCGEEHEERQIGRATDKVRSALGYDARAVWHGRRFTAFAFCDPRRPEQTAASLRGRLHNDHIWDWMIVELVGVTIPAHEGLSPLSTWMQSAGRYQRRRA